MPQKIGLSVAVVLVFIVAFVWIGFQFSDNGLTATGGLAMVAALVLFIFAFAVVGVLLGD